MNVSLPKYTSWSSVARLELHDAWLLRIVMGGAESSLQDEYPPQWMEWSLVNYSQANDDEEASWYRLKLRFEGIVGMMGLDLPGNYFSSFEYEPEGCRIRVFYVRNPNFEQETFSCDSITEVHFELIEGTTLELEEPF